MTEPYQPRCQWFRTELDANDPPTDFDWLGFDDVGLPCAIFPFFFPHANTARKPLAAALTALRFLFTIRKKRPNAKTFSRMSQRLGST